MRLTLLACVMVVLALAGCTSMGAGGLQGMSADQIAASAKVKDMTVACISAAGPWGKTFSVFTSIDKGVMVSGSMNVNGDCLVNFSNTTPPRMPAPTPPPGGLR